MTYERAKELELAGFPKPNPTPGQFWLLDSDLYVIRKRKLLAEGWHFAGVHVECIADANCLPEATYHPTLEEIMQEIGVYVALESIQRDDGRNWFAISEGKGHYGADAEEALIDLYLSLKS